MARADGGPRLDTDKILTAALAVADREGLSGMTLRKVGAELGADPTALYRHFSNKEALVVAMADRLFREVVTADLPTDWRERFIVVMRAARDVYRAHPTIVDVLANQPEDSEGVLAVNEIAIECLADAGLEPAQIGLFHQFIAAYVVGTGLLDATWDTAPVGTREATRRAYSALDPQQYPACVATANSMFPEADDVFDFAIHILLEAVTTAAGRSRGEQPKSTGRPTTTRTRA
jgi:AcrR family transcriptional regulator